MFRISLPNASWPLTSISSRLSSSSVSSFHTSAVLQARRTASSRKRNIQRTQERRIQEAQNKPSIVLGTRAHEEETVWPKCDLAKCLVNPHSLNGPPVTLPSTSTSSSASSAMPAHLLETIENPELGATVTVPKHTNYGIDAPEKEMLFMELPNLTATAPLIADESSFNSTFDVGARGQVSAEALAGKHAAAAEAEKKKMDAFAKVIDLQNANAGGIAYENRRRIILAFSAPENPFDPGRTEVQAALLTYKIRNMWSHLTTFKRDVGNRRGLLKLIHQRAKILRYLKRKDQDRYEALLPRLALDSRSVEGELVL